jgi:hypothetical protein
MAAVALYQEDEALRRLQLLGIRLEWLDQAIRAGVEAATTAAPDEPSVSSGLKDWMARVGMLRQLLRVEAGWVRFDRQGVPLVHNPEKTLALGVMLGNENTGYAHGGHPASKTAKGPAFANITAANAIPLLTRAEVAGPGHLEDAELAGLQVWFLLTYAVHLDGNLHVYREVSLPAPTHEGDKITSWLSRIVLPPMNFGPVALPIYSTPDDRSGLDVLVEPL